MWFWSIFHTELSIRYFIYISFIWHSIEMTKQFFNFLKHICICSYCISQLGYTLQILFLLLNSTKPLRFPFPLTVFTESQPEIACRAGRLSNTPTDHLLVPKSKILSFELTQIWTIKREFIFLTYKAGRVAISLSWYQNSQHFSANWVARATFVSASSWLELHWFNWIYDISFWSLVILYP